MNLFPLWALVGLVLVHGPESVHSSACDDKGAATEAEITTPQTYMDESLARHNQHRLKHGSSPLQLSPELCKYSQYWANFLANRDTGMEHSKDTKCGENLFTGTRKTGYNAATPVDRWYEEEKDYDYDKAEFKKGIGHFTALVWKASRDMCTSWAKSPTGHTYVVSEYTPRGNVVGRFKDNVGRPVQSTQDSKDKKDKKEQGKGSTGGCAEQSLASLLTFGPALFLLPRLLHP